MKVADLITRAVERDDLESLASYIEDGGDLAGLGSYEREILARLVRGHSPRKPGQKISNTRRRDEQVLIDVAYLKGGGLPAYTNVRDPRSAPAIEGRAMDACTVVAHSRGMKPERVMRLWQERDKTNASLKESEEKGRKHQEYARNWNLPPTK